MSCRLKQITLKSFRGATTETTLVFDRKKKILMLFGENGTGKSSIVDAFAFVCERNIGSLKDRSGGNINHLVSVTKQPNDLSVVLETLNSTWQAQLDGSMISVSPTSGYPDVRILRRARITRLIEAQPKDRYNELRAYIEVPGIEASEKALREAYQTAERELKLQNNAYTQAIQALRSYWIKEGNPGDDALSWAKEQKLQNVVTLQSQVQIIGNLIQHIVVLKSKLSASKDKKQHAITTNESYSKAMEEQKEEEKKLFSGSANLLAVLEKTKILLLEISELKKCPVCDQSVEKKTLLEKIETQIIDMNKLTAANNLVEIQTKMLEKAKNTLAVSDEEFIVQFKLTIDALSSPDFSCFEKVDLDLSVFAFPIEKESQDVIIKRAELLISSNICSILADKLAIRNTIVNRKNAINTYLEQIEKAIKEQKYFNFLVGELKRAMEIVEAERKNYVTSVLVDISQEINRLYTFMHPGENLNLLSLYLKPKVQGSLELLGSFHMQSEVMPQAYFSESHLDTLGLCIFLALAKKYKTNSTIIILDDVVTSVDSSHLERVIELINAECDHFSQTIITTHYRPWRERYRYHQAANAKIDFKELRDWSVERGIHIHSTKLAVDELEIALKAENFERRNVANISGILLERFFDNLTLRYKLKLPRKQTEGYTIGEFLSAFDKKIVNFMKVERLDETNVVTETILIEPLLDILRKLTWIRNQIGSHFNVVGEEVSDSDVRNFGQSTLMLAKALVCPISGEIPNKNRQGKCWESESGRTYLYPLMIPER